MPDARYDDETFFNKYAAMARSTGGLEAAGEWPALRAMLPDFAGRRVLDLGCGYGWHCRHAIQHGAASVLGVDASERMLAVAREKNAPPGVVYERRAIEELDFPPGSFDVVLSSLALHYVDDYDGVCRRVAAWLVPDGAFVLSVEHPVFTAAGPQTWCVDDAGARRHWPVDRYFDAGPRSAVFLGEAVAKRHRTLTDWVGGLLRNGFDLVDLVEPVPTDAALAADPAMADERRRPMMLLLSAVQRGASRAGLFGSKKAVKIPGAASRCSGGLGGG